MSRVENSGPNVKLSENAKKLFIAYVEDSGNWGGSPMVGGNVKILGEREDRGLLTHLKRAGLIITWVDEDCGSAFVDFTKLGRAYCAELGHEQPQLTRWQRLEGWVD